MECFHPQVIRNKETGEFLQVPCGHCLACYRNRQNGWIKRLTYEQSQAESSYFITLTYRDADCPCDDAGQMIVYKPDVQKLHMDLRKRFQMGEFLDTSLVPFGGAPVRVSLDSNIKFKYYLVSEYGPEGARPHYHGIYFNLPRDRYTVEELFKSVWRRGFIEVDPCTPRAISYVTKYLVNHHLCPNPDVPRPFALMSKGLGEGYVEKFGDWHRADPANRLYCPDHGTKTTMPRYYRDKIFSDEDKTLYQEKIRKKYDDFVRLTDGMSLEETRAYNRKRKHEEDEAEYRALQIALKKGKIK